MAVPNIFGTATAAIPLSQLDTNFATAITLGNTAVYLGNTTTSLGNLTLTNVTISSGNVTLTGANVSGTANVSTLIVTGNQTSLGNVTITGNVSANIATVSAGTAALPAITTTGDTNTGIFFPAADTVGVSTGGSERLRVDSSGNLLIGTTTTATNRLLNVQGSAVAKPVLIQTTTTTSLIEFNDSGTATKPAMGSVGDALAFLPAGTEGMRLTSTGLGIGTTSPAQKLQIVGSNSTGFAGAAIQNNNANTGIAGVQFSSDATYFKAAIGLVRSDANGKGSIVFYNDSNADAADWATSDEKMRIDSSGNLLVGTTTQIGAEQVGISFADASKNGLGIQVQASTSGAAFTVFRNSSGTLIGSITRNTTTNAVLYNTSSDYRLKENITPLTNALARVSALKPVQWSWKDCDGAVGEGFIAHEVQDVVPAAVSGEKDAVDAEGNIKPQGMDSSYLVATLTAALQEAHGLIKDLQARVDALEAK
jgi:hypothetical protein